MLLESPESPTCTIQGVQTALSHTEGLWDLRFCPGGGKTQGTIGTQIPEWP